LAWLGLLLVATEACAEPGLALVMDRTRSYNQSHCHDRSIQQATCLAMAVPVGTPVILVAFDRQPTVLFSRPITDENRAELRDLIRGLGVSPERGTDVPAALKATAQAIYASGWRLEDFTVYFFSDGISEGVSEALTPTVQTFGRLVGLGVRNPGLLTSGVGPEPGAMERFVSQEIASRWRSPTAWSQLTRWGRILAQFVGLVALFFFALFVLAWFNQRRCRAVARSSRTL
jgi:hypothetical protein